MNRAARMKWASEAKRLTEAIVAAIGGLGNEDHRVQALDEVAVAAHELRRFLERSAGPWARVTGLMRAFADTAEQLALHARRLVDGDTGASFTELVRLSDDTAARARAVIAALRTIGG